MRLWEAHGKETGQIPAGSLEKVFFCHAFIIFLCPNAKRYTVKAFLDTILDSLTFRVCTDFKNL